MIKKLSDKDRRAIRLGILGAVAIFVVWFGMLWLGHWASVRQSIRKTRGDLEILAPDEAKQQGLLALVPVFEMPQPEKEQKFLFREKFDEQFKNAGFKGEPLRYLPPIKSPIKGYRLLRLQCKGKGKYTQLIDLLANLRTNPYLFAVEDLRIRFDQKGREKMEASKVTVEIENLTVSTLVKTE